MNPTIDYVAGELEELARRIAAHKMGLVQDVLGRNLPEDLWQQAIPAARRELAVLGGGRAVDGSGG